MHHHPVKLLPVLLLLLSCACAQQQKQAAAAPERPNIIFILSDDHAYQAISAYGSRLVQTPNIDRIARGGALFRNALVGNSICGPSRATFITGKYSHMNGFRLNDTTRFDTSQLLLPRLLQQHDYQTAWVGKWHLNSLPAGFDYFRILPGQGHYYNPDFIEKGGVTRRDTGYVTDLITQSSINWLQQRDTTQPFFLVVGHKATHREWLPDLQDLGAYDSIDFPLPPGFNDDYRGRVAAKNQDMTIDRTMRLKEDLKVHLDYSKGPVYNRFTPEQLQAFRDYYEGRVSREFDEKQLKGAALVRWKYQRYLKDYLAVARSLDRNIGTLLDYLDKSGLAKNTIVVYTSDQGFYLGEHGWFDKRFIYEESLKTPFLIRYPGVIQPGTTIDQLMVNIDWATTMLDIAGIPVPEDMQGRSFLPLVKGDTAGWRKAAYYHYYEFPQPHHVYPHFGIRTEKYTLVRFYGPADAWELYDLAKDPHEMHNVYGEAAYAQVADSLKQQLAKLAEQYKDKEAVGIIKQ